MLKYINTFTIGVLLLVLYVLQFALGLEWKWLAEMQRQQNYSRWSGFVLGIFIAFQWLLTLTRVIKRWRQASLKWTVIHKWIGAFSPLIFYAHSIEFGYAYLLLLSVIFVLNMLLGTINLDIIKSQKEWVFQGWMIAHVTLSVLITFIMLFHVGVVFYYK